MSYFGFLAIFLIIPIIALIFVLRRDSAALKPNFRSLSPIRVIGLLVVIAVAYTTPWDNYLVATRVWWYDPELVTGITIGWVPIEEYTFFVLQPIFTGLLMLFLMRRIDAAPINTRQSAESIRRRSLALSFAIWVPMVVILLAGWRPGTYLALELGWALLPIMLQLGFGADIIWRNRRLVAAGLIPATLFLAAADALAISSGTWTISPEQSLNWLIFGILPVEELLFFLLTNILIVFAMVLVYSAESVARIDSVRARLGQIGGQASQV